MNTNFFKEIDLKNKSLLSLSKDNLIESPSVLIKNARNKNLFAEFISIAKSFGDYLDYDNKPYKLFDEDSKQEIEYHSDGVSCIDLKRIPKLLFFFAKSWPINLGGNFKFSYTPNIVSLLPSSIIHLMKNQKLQFFNYAGTHSKFIKPKNLDGDVMVFEKHALSKVDGEYKIDLFLPLDKITSDIKWDYLMKFEDLSFEESNKILVEIKKIAISECCQKELPLKNNDILILNNNLFLHGRKAFSQKIKRELYRIQIL